MKNHFEYFLFKFFSLFVRLIGLNSARKFSYLIAFLFFYIIPVRKKTVFANLKIAFPQLNFLEIQKIAFGSYRSFAIALVEILYLPCLTRNELNNLVEMENLDFIFKKYSEEKGIIFLSAHFGNWELGASAVGSHVNIPLNIVVKPQRNPFVDKWMNDARTMWINKIVPLGSSIRQVYKELKEKNIVAMIADQRGPSDGIRVNFFGKQTSIYSGPVVLALKTGAPILYGIAIRQKNYLYKVKFHEVSRENLPENEEEKIRELSQRHASYLEKNIREHPEQWLWMHKIWKY